MRHHLQVFISYSLNYLRHFGRFPPLEKFLDYSNLSSEAVPINHPQGNFRLSGPQLQENAARPSAVRSSAGAPSRPVSSLAERSCQSTSYRRHRAFREFVPRHERRSLHPRKSIPYKRLPEYERTLAL